MRGISWFLLAESSNVIRRLSFASIRSRPRMARGTDGRRSMLLVAIQADAHRRHTGGFIHAIHLRDLPVTHLTFHSGIQVFAMSPGHSWKNCVDARPGNRLLGFRKCREFLNRRFVRGD